VVSASIQQSTLPPAGVLGLAVCAPLLVVGCMTSHRPDVDRVRGAAVPVCLGKVLDDSLRSDAGDQTDWKVVASPAPGELTVALDWHLEHAEGARVTVTDAFGTTLAARPVRDGATRQTIVVPAERGYYFVNVRLEDGSADYSLAVSHRVAPRVAGPEPRFQDVPRPPEAVLER